MKREQAGGGEGRERRGAGRLQRRATSKQRGQGWRKEDKDLRESKRGTAGMNRLSYNTHG